MKLNLVIVFLFNLFIFYFIFYFIFALVFFLNDVTNCYNLFIISEIK